MLKIMDLKEAKETLQRYQDWRLGAETEMLEPKVITESINIILLEIDNLISFKENLEFYCQSEENECKEQCITCFSKSI